jgi:type III restriction enzyme
MVFRLSSYQEEAVESLTEAVLKIWKSEKLQQPIVFKSPTGSGKTLMVAHAIRSLNHLPQWDEDKAFIWITFSEELALQSRDKFQIYFGNNQENSLLTVENISQGELRKNDILFLNWQKLVSKEKENRKLRRPTTEREQKEKGFYFEDLIDKAKSQGRELILIIDEAHTNVTVDLAQEVINYINPRVVFHVSATPKPEVVAKAADIGTYVNVDRQKVVDAGLIKEKIVIQTAEDLEAHSGQDFDHTLLDLGLAKRSQLKAEYEALGKKINPLLLIQLPNDDSTLVSMGQKTKEEIVVDYLESVGVDSKRIGKWFDKNPKPDFIEHNEDQHDILIFKLAAGTGWDCPRAQVLVMFRNIKVEQRYIQTIGRILRTADPENSADYSESPNLRTGYLYTNYHREDIVDNWIDQKSSSPLVFTATRKIGDGGLSIPSEFLSRVEYGDLGSSSKFQSSFCKSMDTWFNIAENDMTDVIHEKLENKGLDLSGSVKNAVVVNAEYENFDHLGLDFKSLGQEVDVEMSNSDVEKTLNFLCWNLLKEQTEEDTRISNISRSWSPLKSALRIWLKNTVSQDSQFFYRVAVSDLLKGANSSIRPAITKALKDYRPILDEVLSERLDKLLENDSYNFSIKETYNFPSDFEKKEVDLCALDSIYLPKDEYPGKKNEAEFMEFLEASGQTVDWWFKQGIGRDYFGVLYTNTASKKPAIFYPDWIIKLQSGEVFILDTKMGRTATDTEGRAEALALKAPTLGKGFHGGIVIKENGQWYVNESVAYEYTPGWLSANWKLLQDTFENYKK